MISLFLAARLEFIKVALVPALGQCWPNGLTQSAVGTASTATKA